MGFGQEMKDFVSAAQAGWKMMTPTSAEVQAKALKESIRLDRERTAAMKQPGTSGSPRVPSVEAGASEDDDSGSSSKDYSGATTDPVNEDLQAHEKALLNAIAGPESNGRYNVRYTPKGGATFEETGKHPGIFEPTSEGKKSSAAGRYQFTKTTWDAITGGKVPFTRENQDAMALKLARRDYESRTGRDLDEDLKTKGLTPDIMKQLAPTWAGFKGAGGRSKAAGIYNASLNRYSGDTSSKAGLPRVPTEPDPDRQTVVQADEEAPATRTAVKVPEPPVRPASVTPDPNAVPIKRVKTVPASAVVVDPPVAIDSATGQPIPPDDPRLQTPAFDRVHGKTSALPGQAIALNGLYANDEDPYLRSGIYARRGGIVPSYAEGGLVEDDDPNEDVQPARAAADLSAIRSMGDNPLAYIQYAAGKGLHQIQDRFGLNSGAIPAESPRAQEGARALAANAGAPDPAMVKQLEATVDPQGQMTDDQRAVHAWGNLIKYYTEKGNPQAVANAGAAMLMHSKKVSQAAGAYALAAIEKGDYQKAAQAVASAYNVFPDGQTIRVNAGGEGGIEYEVVSDKGVGKNGKITPEELKELATGMMNGTQWFQHATQLTQGAKPADLNRQRQSKAIQSFEDEIPEDARGPEDLTEKGRKAWANLPSSYRRSQEAKWKELRKQDKTEGEQAAEAKFYADPEVRDQYRSSLSEEKLKEFDETLTDKQKQRAIGAFEKKRDQDRKDNQFDARMAKNTENRDRSEALKLFGMSVRYGQWQETRKQILTENEQRHADRLMQEEGRDKRQNLSIAQQNKVQENIDRRILEKRTATLDGAGQKLTAAERTEGRRLGAVNDREEAGLTALNERMGPEAAPGEDTGMGEVAAQRNQRAVDFEKQAAPIRAQTGFERVTKGPEAKERAFDPEEFRTIQKNIVERWSAPGEGGKKRTPLSEADQHVMASIGSDMLRTGNMTPEYAGNLTVRAMNPSTPMRVIPERRSVLIGTGSDRQEVYLSGESMMRLAELRGRVGAPPRTGAAANIESEPRQSIREKLAAPGKAREEQRQAVQLGIAASRQPEGSQYQAMKEQLGEWYREGMSFETMQQALRDKYAAEGTRPAIMRRGTR
jgi:muramidase (phage lysozyme)